MSFRVKITFTDFLQVLWIKAKHNVMVQLLLFSVFICLINLIWLLARETSLDTGTWLIFEAFVGLLVLFAIIYVGARNYFRSELFYRELIEYAFTDGGIFVRGESFESIIQWSNVRRIEEYSEYFIINRGATLQHIIPKKQVSKDLSFIREIEESGNVRIMRG